jgi:hypothetical protein
MTQLKNYIGIIRDHSGSMNHIARDAARDYNSNIKAIRESSEQEKQDTIASVVKCGVGHEGRVVHDVVNSSINALEPLNENYYSTDGGQTPLFQSVGELIEQFERVPDAKKSNVSFLIMAITDGEDNYRGRGGWDAQRVARKIQELQATDHWTFIFRVPRGYKQKLVYMGIPEGNILEWEQSSRGVEVASQATAQAFRGFYSARTAGATSTKGFYQTDLSNIAKKDVKKALHDITSQVSFFDVTSADNKRQIREFVENQLGTTMVKGGAFYQFTKKEDEIQDYKIIAVRDKRTKKVYSGTEARTILGLPTVGTVKVQPGNHGEFDLFIQSTSVNRALVGGTQVLYWPNVGVPYQS